MTDEVTDKKSRAPAPADSESGEIKAVREEINRIDAEIIRLLSERRFQSSRAVAAKDAGQSPIRDRRREEEMLVERIRAGRAHGVDSHFITQIFHDIIDDSIRLQQDYLQRRMNAEEGEAAVVRIALNGSEGSFSYLAAEEYFARGATQRHYVSCANFRDAMAAVEKGQADYVMLPIENTTSGGINEVYDLLLHTQLSIVAEKKRRENVSLLGISGAALSGIKKIYCHPQAAWQCGNFLSGLRGCSVEYFSDTAASGKRVREDGDPSAAVIASAEAARYFKLEVLQENIADQQENYSRFIIAARKPKCSRYMPRGVTWLFMR